MFEGIDSIDRVWRSGDVTYAVFSDMEASAILRPQDFTEAGWEGGWRSGEEDDPLLRIQLGQIEFGFSPI